MSEYEFIKRLDELRLKLHVNDTEINIWDVKEKRLLITVDRTSLIEFQVHHGFREEYWDSEEGEQLLLLVIDYAYTMPYER
ncbi:hypothetical protein [Mammaliicoccus virus vB_MscM-PMS2]|nr:hypothetical protein [Mammaliicoccus virus vB_MscM-PMS2]